MTTLGPINGDPVLLGGAWIDQDEGQWLANAADQIKYSTDQDTSAGGLFTAANMVVAGLQGQAGEATTGQYMRHSNTKRNVGATAKRLGGTFTQAGQNVIAGKTMQNNVLAAYQTASNTNKVLAASQGWPPYRAAAEEMNLRGQTRTTMQQIRTQFDGAMDSLLGDHQAGRDPSPQSRMKGSDGVMAPGNGPGGSPGTGGKIPTGNPGTPSPGSPLGNVDLGGGLAGLLTKALGDPKELAGALQAAAPLMAAFMPVIATLATAGMTALGGTAGMNPGAATLGSPMGTNPLTGTGLGTMPGMGTPTGNPSLSGLLGQPGSPGGLNVSTPGMGIPTSPGTGTSPLGSLLGGKNPAIPGMPGSGPDSGPSGKRDGGLLGKIGDDIDDLLSGKTRLGITHDEDGQVRVDSIGTDGARRDIFTDAGDRTTAGGHATAGGSDGSTGPGGSSGGSDPREPTAPSSESHESSTDKSGTTTETSTSTESTRPKPGEGFPGPGESTTDAPATETSTGDQSVSDQAVTAGTPVDSTAPSTTSDDPVTSGEISAHLTSDTATIPAEAPTDQPAPRAPHLTAGALGTDLTAAALATPPATGASPITPHAAPSMAAPVAPAPMAPPMMPPMGGMGGMGGMAPAAGAGGPASGTGPAVPGPAQVANAAVLPDAPAAHTPITPRMDHAAAPAAAASFAASAQPDSSE